MKHLRMALQLGSIALIIVAGLVALSGRTNILGGYRLYSVLTGSMEPTLPVSSLLVVKGQTAPYAVGDVITFEQPGERRLVTHRIVEVEPTENSLVYRTKGDANPVMDSWLLTQSDIKGKMLRHVPQLGKAVTLLNSPVGIGLLVVLPALVLAYQDISAIQRSFGAWIDERQTTKKEHHV